MRTRIDKKLKVLFVLAVLNFMLTSCIGQIHNEETDSGSTPESVPSSTGSSENTEESQPHESTKENPMSDPSTALETVEVQYSELLGKRNNLSGFLHGWDAYKPANSLIDKVSPAVHRVGIQDASVHYKRSQELESKPELILVISDAISKYYGQFYPGKDMSLPDFSEFIKKQYNAAVNAGVDMSKVIIDVWNEPDGPCWHPYDDIRKNRDSYMEMWKTAYNTVKGLNPEQRIMGCCVSHVREKTAIDSDYYGFFREWLDYCLDNACLPDYINWHMLEDELSPSEEIADVRKIFAEKKLECPPIVIDEVINDTDNSAGCAAWFLAQLQRSGVLYAGHAVWIRDQLDQLLFITDQGRWGKTSEYHMYTVYAQMDGELAASVPSKSLDLIAVNKGDRGYILLGNNRSFTGTAGIRISGIGYENYEIKLYHIPDKNGGAVTEEEILPIWEQSYTNSDEAVLAFDWMNPKDGYYLVIEKIS